MHIFAMLIEKLKKHLLRLAAGENNAFYINGTDVLPTPLSQAQEAAYLKRLENGDAEARKVLIEKNLRLVVFIAKKFDSVTCGIEDLISIGTIGLIKAINTFRTDKNIKLATYASRCIENEILMYLRKTSGKGQVLSIDEPLNVDWEGNELLLCDVLSQDGDTVYHRLETNEDHKLIHRAISHLSAREKTIIKLRFGIDCPEEKTQKEVADLLGISQSYISRLEKKIIQDLRDELSCNF
jgi:RNA polymerase sporulation-specific sigma factor